MDKSELVGWHRLLEGYPWFQGKNRFPLPAYSEFMPPPRLGRRPYGEEDTSIFSEDDPFGWHIPEVEMEYEIRPGLASLAQQIVTEIVELGEGKPASKIAGHDRRNLRDNPFWPPELAARAGKLPGEKFVVLLPLALSKTQDDKGRVRWTYFGSSEQGPERAFWRSFSSGPTAGAASLEAFLARLISLVYGERCDGIADLRAAGFRVLPSEPEPPFPYWHPGPPPASLGPLLWQEGEDEASTRYLLTFRPFSRLPEPVRRRYLAGALSLLPFPGSLAFWGMPNYLKLQSELPLAMQLPLQRLAARQGGSQGLRVPQSGWFHEAGEDFKPSAVQQGLLLNRFRRTSRWDRVRRHADEVVQSTIEDTVARTLFSSHLDSMGLYGKPMARNCQLWTADSRLLLDGPNASPEALEEAARAVAQGGNFRYRFQFPPMRVGRHEIYWQLPLAAYWSQAERRVEMLPNPPLGYLTAYLAGENNLAHPLELEPRPLDREPYRLALRNYGHLEEHYAHQTVLNILRILDSRRRWGPAPLPRGLARQVLRLPERLTLEEWLEDLPGKAQDAAQGQALGRYLAEALEPARPSESITALPRPSASGPSDLPITLARSASRRFEESWWNEIVRLSTGEYSNKDNADCVLDAATLPLLKHRQRDLENIGDYLLGRYRAMIKAAGLENQAICGELPFRWQTDFNFSAYGGWSANQSGETHERDIVLVIPGKNRAEAVVMADHYDTAYEEDLYEKSRGGSGARISAAGADDNYSATATLLQGAPLFLDLAKEGKLERDIWLVHLTGEEFPADCLGARHLAKSLVEKDLALRTGQGAGLDLNGVEVKGVVVLDMIGHNRDSYQDVFQISPGKGRASLRLAWQAHTANALWNSSAALWNESPERRGKGRARRVAPGQVAPPPPSAFLPLQGEVRLNEDPHSSLFNTDGQIFSDCGVPVILLMENYDINRSGYHDQKDTLENIDLDYGSALAAIAIETVARIAAAPRSGAA